MSEPTYRFGLVCEGREDVRTVKALVRRVYQREIPWLRGELFDELIGWTGVESHTEFTRWAKEGGVKELARRAGFRVHGDFQGQSGRGDAIQAKKALLLFRKKILAEDSAAIPLVILFRDTDGERERRDGVERARDSFPAKNFEIVVGVAHPKRECWVLLALDPTEAEQQRIKQLRRGGEGLGFDPTKRPEKLTASSSEAKREAKAVLSAIVDGDQRRREQFVWSAADLDGLEAQGEQVGLRQFLVELRERIPSEIGSAEYSR